MNVFCKLYVLSYLIFIYIIMMIFFSAHRHHCGVLQATNKNVILGEKKKGFLFVGYFWFLQKL